MMARPLLVAALLALLAAGGTWGMRAQPPAAAAAALRERAPQRPRPRGGTVGTYTPEAEADRVDELPGTNEPLDFGLFAGYVTVDRAAGRALFYAFAEAKAGAADAPLVLWLNGGPGCSSLGGGFMSEIGPFYPRPGGQTLQANPYAWNAMANVLWLESPAFVGFSYSNTSADAFVGDARTAADARVFLLGWLDRFPQYAASPLFLSGESYGGHYVPNLALEIVRGNERARPGQQQGQQQQQGEGPQQQGQQGRQQPEGVSPGRGFINLGGFFVGNAWTDASIDNEGALDFWFTHAMIGDESYRHLKDSCDFSRVGPLARGAEALALPGTHARAGGAGAGAAAGAAAAAGAVGGSGLGHSRAPGGWGGPPEGGEGRPAAPRDAECSRWLERATAEYGNINIYQIYADVCLPDPANDTAAAGAGAAGPLGARQQRQQQPRRRPAEGGRYMGALLGRSAASLAGRRHPHYDPCVDGEVETYLNLPEVQAALHANQSVKLPWRWTDCTQAISYSREDLLSSMLPTYRELLGTGLRMWVYSGDVDGIVPVLGTRRWVASLNLPVVEPWRPWVSSTGQVAGWRVDYQNLTFATVRNAGHMVPYTQPERTYHLLGQFLFGDQPAPSASTRATASRGEGVVASRRRE